MSIKKIFAIKTNKNYFFSLIFFLIILLLNLAFSYIKYCQIQRNVFKNEDFLLLNIYEKTAKNGKNYEVLKLQKDRLILYTTSFKKTLLNKGDFINMDYKINKLSFLSYLKKSYLVSSKNLKKIPKQEITFKQKLEEKIQAQHENQTMKEFFSALYLASNIDIKLRNDINKWGSSHLIVISGYHLVVIFSSLYFLLNLFYSFFQKRYFPHRNKKFDLSLIIFTFLAYYLYLLDFAPSFLRSFFMAVFAFILLIKDIKITSFKFLFLIYLALVSINLQLLFSLSFYFSCLGVFYIYLYLHHFKTLSQNIILHFLYFNIFVYFMMNIIVFYFFPKMSYFQPSVIFITLLFNIFYPLSIFLHLLNFGAIFDNFILKFLNYEIFTKDIIISTKLFLFYNILTFSSIFSKKLAITTFLLSLFVTYTF